MKCSSVFTSTTNHVFTFERVTLCTIILMHKDTGQQYVVIFTDNNKIRDYKTGIVPQFGELKCVFRSIRSRIGIEVRSAIRIHSINR
ncbi:hypothetical protein OU550_24840, partial [Escherichia coli]|nr:hypothetical protein [Escherichia coli]